MLPCPASFTGENQHAPRPEEQFFQSLGFPVREPHHAGRAEAHRRDDIPKDRLVNVSEYASVTCFVYADHSSSEVTLAGGK